MAQIWSTGPVHIFVGTGGTSNFSGRSLTPAFLGRAEKAPQIVENPLYEPVFNDAGGQMEPIDELFQGVTASVSVVLTQWNEAVLRSLSAVGQPGSTGVTAFGQPMAQFGLTYPVYLLFQNAALPGYAGMPGGYRFWSCKMVNHQVMPGTTAQRHQFVWDAKRAFVPVGSSPLTTVPLKINSYSPSLMAMTYDFNVSEVSSLSVA